MTQKLHIPRKNKAHLGQKSPRDFTFMAGKIGYTLETDSPASSSN